MPVEITSNPVARGHAGWVRLAHWFVATGVLTLAFTGFVILMAHPRLYWGETGNALTKPLLELPISRNHRHGGWSEPTPFFATPASPVTSNRVFPDMFNQNSWARSLHFLAAWCAVLGGLAYLVTGLLTGHVRRDLWPGSGDLAPRRLQEDISEHLGLRIRNAAGLPYGPLQKITYCVIVFVVVPVMVITGLAMSPAITAAFPPLQDLFGGSQSSRTVHFFLFTIVVAFVIVHVFMVVLSGFRRQMRAMTFGSRT